MLFVPTAHCRLWIGFSMWCIVLSYIRRVCVDHCDWWKLGAKQTGSRSRQNRWWASPAETAIGALKILYPVLLSWPYIFPADRLYCTVGVHPTYCSLFTDPNNGFEGDPDRYQEELLVLATSTRAKVVAIGECGLGEIRGQFQVGCWIVLFSHFVLTDKQPL